MSGCQVGYGEEEEDTSPVKNSVHCHSDIMNGLPKVSFFLPVCTFRCTIGGLMIRPTPSGGFRGFHKKQPTSVPYAPSSHSHKARSSGRIVPRGPDWPPWHESTGAREETWMTSPVKLTE